MLSEKNINDISSFFGRKALTECFIALYRYQLSLRPDTVVAIIGNAVGFGCRGERLRLCVARAGSDFLLKVSTQEGSFPFYEKDILSYMTLLVDVHMAYVTEPEKYLLSRRVKIEKRESLPEDTDWVLGRLENKEGARIFSLDDFNSLADWEYCSSFGNRKYIYTFPNGNKIECDSKSELRLIRYLVSKGLTQAIGGQNLRIKYDTAFRKGADYFPDIVMLTSGGRIAIAEVKPITAMSYHLNVEKYAALSAYCRERGYEYMMIDPSNGYKTFSEMKNMSIPKKISERINAYVAPLIGKTGTPIIESADVDAIHRPIAEECAREDFEIYLHAAVIQNGWYNKFKHGFMVYETPQK